MRLWLFISANRTCKQIQLFASHHAACQHNFPGSSCTMLSIAKHQSPGSGLLLRSIQFLLGSIRVFEDFSWTSSDKVPGCRRAVLLWRHFDYQTRFNSLSLTRRANRPPIGYNPTLYPTTQQQPLQLMNVTNKFLISRSRLWVDKLSQLPSFRQQLFVKGYDRCAGCVT